MSPLSAVLLLSLSALSATASLRCPHIATWEPLPDPARRAFYFSDVSNSRGENEPWLHIAVQTAFEHGYQSLLNELLGDAGERDLHSPGGRATQAGRDPASSPVSSVVLSAGEEKDDLLERRLNQDRTPSRIHAVSADVFLVIRSTFEPIVARAYDSLLDVYTAKLLASADVLQKLASEVGQPAGPPGTRRPSPFRDPSSVAALLTSKLRFHCFTSGIDADRLEEEVLFKFARQNVAMVYATAVQQALQEGLTTDEQLDRRFFLGDGDGEGAAAERADKLRTLGKILAEIRESHAGLVAQLSAARQTGQAPRLDPTDVHGIVKATLPVTGQARKGGDVSVAEAAQLNAEEHKNANTFEALWHLTNRVEPYYADIRLAGELFSGQLVESFPGEQAHVFDPENPAGTDYLKIIKRNWDAAVQKIRASPLGVDYIRRQYSSPTTGEDVRDPTEPQQGATPEPPTEQKTRATKQHQGFLASATSSALRATEEFPRAWTTVPAALQARCYDRYQPLPSVFGDYEYVQFRTLDEDDCSDPQPPTLDQLNIALLYLESPLFQLKLLSWGRGIFFTFHGGKELHAWHQQLVANQPNKTAAGAPKRIPAAPIKGFAVSRVLEETLQNDADRRNKAITHRRLALVTKNYGMEGQVDMEDVPPSPFWVAELPPHAERMVIPGLAAPGFSAPRGTRYRDEYWVSMAQYGGVGYVRGDLWEPSLDIDGADPRVAGCAFVYQTRQQLLDRGGILGPIMTHLPHSLVQVNTKGVRPDLDGRLGFFLGRRENDKVVVKLLAQNGDEEEGGRPHSGISSRRLTRAAPIAFGEDRVSLFPPPSVSAETRAATGSRNSLTVSSSASSLLLSKQTLNFIAATKRAKRSLIVFALSTAPIHHRAALSKLQQEEYARLIHPREDDSSLIGANLLFVTRQSDAVRAALGVDVVEETNNPHVLLTPEENFDVLFGFADVVVMAGGTTRNAVVRAHGHPYALRQVQLRQQSAVLQAEMDDTAAAAEQAEVVMDDIIAEEDASPAGAAPSLSTTSVKSTTVDFLLESGYWSGQPLPVILSVNDCADQEMMGHSMRNLGLAKYVKLAAKRRNELVESIEELLPVAAEDEKVGHAAGSVSRAFRAQMLAKLRDAAVQLNNESHDAMEQAYRFVDLSLGHPALDEPDNQFWCPVGGLGLLPPARLAAAGDRVVCGEDRAGTWRVIDGERLAAVLKQIVGSLSH